jgi:predicted DCC family thiol-disulfide oxidoreductase YuxK
MSAMVDANGATSGLLIFDGDCGFCTTSARWIQRALPAAPAVSPYQWTNLEAHGLSTDDAQSRVWLVTANGKYGGHNAIAALLRHQPVAVLRVAGWLMSVPPWSWVAALGYALVARYRYLLPGGTPACQLKP